MPGPVWLPPVPGDPAGMRALASSLRRTAEQISGVDADVGSTVSSMTFEGPAGTASARLRLRAGGPSLPPRTACRVSPTCSSARPPRSSRRRRTGFAGWRRWRASWKPRERSGRRREADEPSHRHRSHRPAPWRVPDPRRLGGGLAGRKLARLPRVAGDARWCRRRGASRDRRRPPRGFESLAPILNEDAVELERRALWAEIADQLSSGRELEGSQLREFLAWMKDGSLLRYADVDQAEAAGAYIGAMYRDNFKDPEELFELAQILHASQENAHGDELDAFSAAFVDRFGAENLVEVPRVIQAIEWSHVLSSGMTMTVDPHVLHDVAYRVGRSGPRARPRRGPARALRAGAGQRHLQRPALAHGRGRDRARRGHLGDRAAPPYRRLRDPVPARVLPHRRRRQDRRALALRERRRAGLGAPGRAVFARSLLE